MQDTERQAGESALFSKAVDQSITSKIQSLSANAVKKGNKTEGARRAKNIQTYKN